LHFNTIGIAKLVPVYCRSSLMEFDKAGCKFTSFKACTKYAKL